MIDITLLGSGGGMPVPNRFLSSAILSYRGRKILIDCGEGTQVSMKINSTGFKAIDVIVISHCHGDHIFGLPGLLSTIGNSDRLEPITIIGPRGIKDVLDAFRVLLPYLPYKVNILEDPIDPILFNIQEGILAPLSRREAKKKKTADITISTIGLLHSSPCLGYSFYIKRGARFQVEKAEENRVPKILWNRLQKGEYIEYEGKIYEPSMVLGRDRKGIKISYITDTRPHVNIEAFIENSDLLICEGTYGSDEDIEKALKNRHMTFREAAQMSRGSSVDKLIITHFSPAMVDPKEYINNALEEFPETILAYDGLTTSLSFKE